MGVQRLKNHKQKMSYSCYSASLSRTWLWHLCFIGPPGNTNGKSTRINGTSTSNSARSNRAREKMAAAALLISELRWIKHHVLPNVWIWDGNSKSKHWVHKETDFLGLGKNHCFLALFVGSVNQLAATDDAHTTSGTARCDRSACSETFSGNTLALCFFS
jgi:hypothetical protein